ncbi:hypothetical protein PVK06_023526 [Gossypium arboreum]|uniref:Uncharacterized protein n=1 Tax=Gossypium arboreum TaxID=29729 RepID=A0ABR0PBC0_GOSAR|nr:hypothetical protein PVK06_023526 [Gossypium arboreum]
MPIQTKEDSIMGKRKYPKSDSSNSSTRIPNVDRAKTIKHAEANGRVENPVDESGGNLKQDDVPKFYESAAARRHADRTSKHLRFEHTPRSANGLAHILATETLKTQEEIYLVEGVPRFAELQKVTDSEREPD